MNAKILKYVLIIASLVLAGLILWYFKSIVVYIIISAILSLTGNPIVKLLDKIKIRKIRLPHALNAGITLVLLWTLVFTFFWIFIPLVANEANALSEINITEVQENLKEPLSEIEEIATQLHLTDKNTPSLQNLISEKIASVLNVSHISNIFNSLANMLGNIFIAIFSISFITFFFLKDDKLFVSMITLFTPKKYISKVQHALSSIKNLLVRYFIGIGIEVILVMTLITIGMLIVGIEFQHAIIIGLFVGLMNIVPYIGPIIGAIFGIIIGIAINIDLDFYTQILPLIGYMTIVFISVQVIDNILFQPLIYSNSVNAHPLEIFLIIMIGASLAGITGMVLAIPGYTILRVFAKEFLNHFEVINRLTKNI